MRLFIACATLALSLPIAAQTEADILKWAEEGNAKLRAGELSPLQFYRELHRRIAVTPSAEYQFRAENLRVIGYRVNVYEDVEAGKINPERAERMIAEQQAQWEADQQAQDRAAEDARKQALRADFERQQRAQAQREQAQAQDDAQRRALALQLLQSGAFRRQPYQVPFTPLLVQRPAPPVNCTSMAVGNQIHTNCR